MRLVPVFGSDFRPQLDKQFRLAMVYGGRCQEATPYVHLLELGRRTSRYRRDVMRRYRFSYRATCSARFPRYTNEIV